MEACEGECGREAKHICAGLDCECSLCAWCLSDKTSELEIAKLGELWWCPQCTTWICYGQNTLKLILEQAVTDGNIEIIDLVCIDVPLSFRRDALRRAVRRRNPDVVRVLLKHLPVDTWLDAFTRTICAIPGIAITVRQILQEAIKPK